MGTEKSPIWFQVPGLVSLIWPGLERTAEQRKANRRTREKRTAEPGKSEPQNRRIMNRRMSKDGIAALCLFYNPVIWKEQVVLVVEAAFLK
jgi:hypothetical protein